MSGFAVVYEFSNNPVDPNALKHIMERLNHRGPDGSDAYLNNHIAMGHWHFWTTPEEVGEYQPLGMGDLPFKLVFDGRIDNRDDLFTSLSIAPEQRCQISDAVLVLYAYAAWGKHCVERFIGEFALVLFDEHLHTLFCARDPMGTRSLFYARYGSQIFIASEPWAIVAGTGLKAEVDEVAAAHYFAFRAPLDGQTLFKEIFELLPGYSMQVTDNGALHLSFYWQPDPDHKIRYKNDEEYAEHFLALMDESVRCRMRAPVQPGVLMSGGLDSTTIASLVARHVSPAQLFTYSYVFDDFHECDERIYIHEIQKKYNTHSSEIPVDDLWPFHNWPQWLPYPNYPISDVYWSIRYKTYQRIHQDGGRVILSGDFGDALYADDEDWLGALLLDGHLVRSVVELVQHIRNPKLRKTFFRFHFRPAIRHIVDTLTYGLRFSYQKSSIPPWLTPFAADLLSKSPQKAITPHMRFNSLTNPWISQMNAFEPYYSLGLPIELRYPSRDRRLVEFMMSIPSYQLYQRGIHRQVLRKGMEGILPEKNKTRQDKTGLLPLYFWGLSKKKDQLRTFLLNTQHIWSPYIDTNGLSGAWFESYDASQDGAQKVIPWLCLSYVIWYRILFSDMYFSK